MDLNKRFKEHASKGLADASGKFCHNRAYRHCVFLAPKRREVPLAAWFHTAASEKLILENLKTFNQINQRFKLCSPLEGIGCLVDKYLASDFVAGRAARKCLAPLLGIWDNLADKDIDIDFDVWLQSFAPEVTHGCGQNVIMLDKRWAWA